MSDYSHFKAEDFAADDGFIRWVNFPDSSTSQFWNQWILQHPEKREVVARARQLVLTIRFEEQRLSPDEMQQMWHTIDANTQDEAAEMHSPFLQMRLFRIAAGLLLLISVAAGVLFYTLRTENSIFLTTKTSQIRTATLPDGTLLTLNANSSVKYSKTLLTNSIREVWLEGEAFFEVKKLSTAAHFVVHTPELTVEVLGTKFNVNTRRQRAKVVLKEGKVALHVQQNRMDSTITMQPGDMVEYSKASEKSVKKTVNPQNYTSWTQNRLIFHESTLREIAEVMEDTQGVRLQFSDPSFENLVFSGSVASQDTDLLLRKLAKAFHLKITRSDSLVQIEKPDIN